jgi:Putative porin
MHKRRHAYGVYLCLSLCFAMIGSSAIAEDKIPLEELLIEKGVLTKEDAGKVQKTVLTNWVDQLAFFGDLRVRDEQLFDNNNANGSLNGGTDQNRVRFRLRLNAKLKISDLTVGIQVASGNGGATGTNQTESNLFTQKGLWINRAYISWQGSSTRWLKLTAGKMANPFFVLYSGDLVWDADVNPEGFAENVIGRPGNRVSLFLNAGQFVLNEVSTDNHDQWLFGQQGGVSIGQWDGLKTTLAVADYDFVNVDHPNTVGGGTPCGLGQNPTQQGNTRMTCPVGTGTYLLNKFNVLDVTALVNVRAGPFPVALMGDYVRNLADTNTAAGVATGNEGYQVGAIVGKASDPHTWELAYFYKVSQTDATVADIADSDFGSGGTAHRGHIVWGAYNLTTYFQMKVKYFMTKSIAPVATTQSGCNTTLGCGDINRLQADMEVKF